MILMMKYMMPIIMILYTNNIYNKGDKNEKNNCN